MLCQPYYPGAQDAVFAIFMLCHAVFTTSQKKTMLKWLEKLNGQEAAAAAGTNPSAAAAVRWTLLDITSSSAEVMNEEGDTQQVC